jgi:CO dehydrogenase nickel-insertion accessory protein CooC1
VVGNKIRGQPDRKFLEKYVAGFEWLGFFPYDENIIGADLRGETPYDQDTPAKTVVREIMQSL